MYLLLFVSGLYLGVTFVVIFDSWFRGVLNPMVVASAFLWPLSMVAMAAMGKETFRERIGANDHFDVYQREVEAWRTEVTKKEEFWIDAMTASHEHGRQLMKSNEVLWTVSTMLQNRTTSLRQGFVDIVAFSKEGGVGLVEVADLHALLEKDNVEANKIAEIVSQMTEEKTDGKQEDREAGSEGDGEWEPPDDEEEVDDEKDVEEDEARDGSGDA